MSRAGDSAIRASSFVRKELGDILRQPRLVVTLVLGPFLILLVFGAGLKDVDPFVQTVLVAPAGSELAKLAERFAAVETSRPLVIAGITADRDGALDRLREGEIDLVVVLPDGAERLVRSGEQAPVTFFHNFVDPVEIRALEVLSRRAVQTINDQVSLVLVERGQEALARTREQLVSAQQSARLFREALERGDLAAAGHQLEKLQGDVRALGLLVVAAGVVQSALRPLDDGGREAGLGVLVSIDQQIQALSEGGDLVASVEQARTLEADVRELVVTLDTFLALSPKALVTPFEGRVDRVTGGGIDLTDFYAPAVVVLLIQHLVITFLGLSFVREEELGMTELFRAAPLSALEILTGKSLAYLLLGGTVALVLTGLLGVGLGVPVRGSWWLVLGSVAALLAASTALGLVIALLADSDSQAVQYAMIVLLASVFLGGFILSLDRFQSPLNLVAWLLPATYGMQLLRSAMLRTSSDPTVSLAALAAMAAVLFVAAWLLLRRRLARG